MNDLTSKRKAYHDWIAAEGPHQTHVPNAVDAYVAALEAEVERVNRELDNMRAMWDKDSIARRQLTIEVERLREALRELLEGMGIVMDDPRLPYVEVQLERVDLLDARAALAGEGDEHE